MRGRITEAENIGISLGSSPSGQVLMPMHQEKRVSMRSRTTYKAGGTLESTWECHPPIVESKDQMALITRLVSNGAFQMNFVNVKEPLHWGTATKTLLKRSFQQDCYLLKLRLEWQAQG